MNLENKYVQELMKRKEIIIKMTWIATEIILLNVMMHILQQQNVITLMSLIGAFAFICTSKEGTVIRDIFIDIVDFGTEKYSQLYIIKERMIDIKCRVDLVICWTIVATKKLLDLRKDAPIQFCSIVCTTFAVLGHIGSLTTVINFVYLATVGVNLIRERTESLCRSTETLAKAADVSLLRFEAQVKRESEDLYDDIVLSDEFHSDEGSDGDQVFTPTNIRTFTKGSARLVEQYSLSPVLQLTDQKEKNVLEIAQAQNLEFTPMIEIKKEALHDETISTSDLSKSLRKKKLFSLGTNHEEFDPIDMIIEPGSPRSTVKKQISSSKSILSFLSRHK